MKVLVIEDEQPLAEALRRGLTENAYFTDIASDGVSGLCMARETQYDLILLDLLLPDMDGFELLDGLCVHDAVAVIAMNEQDDLSLRVRALEQGADDYLLKPFAFPELLARIVAIQRRVKGEGCGVRAQNLLRVGDLEMDLLRRRVSRGRARIDLSAKEFGLLALLMRRQGEVVSRLVLAEQVWNKNFNSNTNIVEVAIKRLRAKIDDPFGVKLLHTVRGMGYTLELRNV
ncbi:two-component response regulator [Bordetella ansorpii]|uniref:Two-component response regulator n=1 Tax=Bordetella ansorpii TaxID=288768 RepID=A0A157S4Y5_9BORD|nr:winged helix-turn-helix domain-containing protein [Bordetella ansorpii]SAI65472.1 two-component response regulator [Bordetella ansorpii]